MIPIVEFARISPEPPFFARGPRKGHTLATRAGIRYEHKAQRYLKHLYPENYTPAPWIEYQLRGEDGVWFVEPDGLFFNFQKREIIVVEVKLSHVASAFLQLRRYAAIVEKLFKSQWKVGIIEVCKQYDCWIPCPIKPKLVDDFSDLNLMGFPVLVWGG